MAVTEFSKISRIVRKLPPAKKELAQKLLKKAAFMEIELEKLQEIITEKGWTEKYQNGANQYGIKKSSEGDVYNTLIKNYTTVIAKLHDIVKEDSQPEADDLMEFLKK